MTMLKIIGIAIGGAALLYLADTAALSALGNPLHAEWVSMMSELVTASVIGVIGGRLVGKSAWPAAAAGPVLYFGAMSLLLRNAAFLWMDLQMPLAVIASLTASFLAASSACDRTG